MALREFTVADGDSGRRLDAFIRRVCPAMPYSTAYKLIRSKDIRVNGRRADSGARLNAGDIVRVFAPEEFLAEPEPVYDFMSAPASLDVVYEDENILLLNKKQGVLSHPDSGEFRDTLITRVLRYLYEKGEYDPAAPDSFTPALANRIDRNTGGIVMAAKNAEALRILNEKIKLRELTKKYLCVTVGAPKNDAGTLTGYTVKNESTNTVAVYSRPVPGARTTVTKYRVLKRKNGLALVEAELLTGRTHQIRAQFADAGFPLLGDGKYGSNADNKRFGGYKKQCLCSYKLTFDFKTDAGLLNYLKNRTFELKDVWFREELFGGN